MSANFVEVLLDSLRVQTLKSRPLTACECELRYSFEAPGERSGQLASANVEASGRTVRAATES